jgi:hypothetical protein
MQVATYCQCCEGPYQQSAWPGADPASVFVWLLLDATDALFPLVAAAANSRELQGYAVASLGSSEGAK